MQQRRLPHPGASGPSGSAAFFDGVNDAVRVPQVAGQGTTNYLSVAAWIYPTKRPDIGYADGDRTATGAS